MAISWGAYENHLRVGIDYSVTPASPSYADTKVTVTWKFYVGTDNWNWGDGQTAAVDSTGWGGTSVGYTNNLGPYEKMLVHTQSVSYSISSSSGTATATIDVSGAYNGATPSKSRTINLPDRPSGPPPAPAGRSTSSITGTSVVLDWAAITSTPVDVYQLQVDDSSGFGSPHYSNAALPNANPVTITGLTPNKTYYWRVRAHNSSGWGPFASTISFTTAATLPPGTPGTPTLSSRTATSVSVAWKASAANGGASLTYTAEISTNSGFTAIVATSSGLTSPAATFTGLTAGTPYWVRARATTTVGTGSNSGALSTSTLAASPYADADTLLGKIVDLAEAVGEKMVHLGAHMFAEKTTADTLAAGDNTIAFSGTVSTMGPDNPTRSGGTFTCQYPGEYLLEFGYRFDESVAGPNGLKILINGTVTADAPFSALGAATTLHRTLSCSRRLAAGDTVTFVAAATTAQTTPSGGRCAWGRAVMTGF